MSEQPGEICFQAVVVHWRGPSPFFFAVVPERCAPMLRRAASAVSYGWGMIPIEARIGDIAFRTALIPKDGTYFLPLRDQVRRQADIVPGDAITVMLRLPDGTA